jgi:hypothetical protein
MYMTGGQLQLVAYGAQDIILTGNPMITYFKVVYRRHTNFSSYSAEQGFINAPYFGRESSVIISNQGDLVAGLYLQVKLPNLVADGTTYVRWTDDIGHHLIDWVEITISGRRIDRHYGDWLEIWAQLTLPASQELGYREAIGQDPKGPLGIPLGLQRPVNNGQLAGRMIYVPFQFWFCRNIGLALPMIAMQYSEVRLTVKFRDLRDLVVNFDVDGTPSAYRESAILDASLWVDYILLDTDERRRFAQVPHEYLIEQVQRTNETIVDGDTFNNRSVSIDLNFHHPVKELVWVCRYDNAVIPGLAQWSNYSDRSALIDYDNDIQIERLVSLSYTSKNPVVNAALYLNGNLRFSTQSGCYFNKYVPVRTHTRAPDSPGINVFSFALKPESHQPSGSCNFSRLHDAYLRITLSPGSNHTLNANDLLYTRFRNSSSKIYVYAVNQNIFRVMSGMAGIAYL